MIRIIFLYLVLLPQFAVLNCQDSPKMIIDSFFVKLEASGTGQALDYIYATNPWIGNNSDDLRNLRNQMASLDDEKFVGKYFGYDFITEESVNSRFKLYSYLVRYGRQPIRYTFQFYKPDEKWMLYAFKFDGNLSSELEEAAKIYFQNNKF